MSLDEEDSLAAIARVPPEERVEEETPPAESVPPAIPT
jgi:hypothetical protein